MGKDAWEFWVQPGRGLQLNLPLLSEYNTESWRRISEHKNVYLWTKHRWNNPIKMEGTEK